MTTVFPAEMRRNPYPFYQQVRSTSPVLRNPELDAYSVFDYEGVKRILNDPESFSSLLPMNTGEFDDLLITQDPPRHTKLRALVAPAFTARLVSSLERRIEELSRQLLDRVIERGQMDLVTDFATPLPMMVIAEMLGVPEVDRPRFKHWTEMTANAASHISADEAAARWLEEFRRTKREMERYFKGILDERRTESQSREDVIGKLLEAEVDGERLTEKQIFDFFHLLLAAGSETTTHLISNTILCFSENPDQFDMVRRDPGLLPFAIEEVLRYRSPVQIVFRWSKRDVEVHGQMIPAGKIVLPMLGSANRDPGKFPDPERFDVTRSPNPHVAFGHGSHFCLGATLSRLEARVALTVLLERAQDVELSSDKPWEPVGAPQMHGPASLPIRFQPGQRAASHAASAT